MPARTRVRSWCTRLWVAARAIQALATLWFAVLARRRRMGSSSLAFSLLGGLAVVAVLSIFAGNLFPLCFVEGVGVTSFKLPREPAPVP